MLCGKVGAGNWQPCHLVKDHEGGCTHHTEDAPLANSMDIVLTDTDKLQVALAQAKQELAVAHETITNALRSLKCAGKGALKDKAVQATIAVLGGR